MRRCYSIKNNNYKYYGARGIKVSKEWHDFFKFNEWCETTYVAGHTIDRIDNNKGYSSKNCRWANTSTQISNRRKTKAMLLHNQKLREDIARRVKEKFGDPATRTTKRCYKCKEFKKLNLFVKNKGTIDGLACICLSCNLVRMRLIKQKAKMKKQATAEDFRSKNER